MGLLFTTAKIATILFQPFPATCRNMDQWGDYANPFPRYAADVIYNDKSDKIKIIVKKVFHIELNL